MKNLLFSVLILILTSISLAEPGAVLDFAKANNKTMFKATGRPAMIKINGEDQGPSGQIKLNDGELNGTLTLNLDGLTTKIDLRDEHMKNKYLEIAKYPDAQIIFKKTKSGFKLTDAENKSQNLVMTAEFQLRGKTLPIQLTADLTKKLNSVTGQARFTIKASDYLDTLPSYAGIKVADEVEVIVDVNCAIK
ncbi:MAG: YceI family protein [Moraxellaceae bacterium]|nr:YceI family protein [Pseudobdellovibrionaceae bacterium]